jgi:hypothetical protein
MDADQIIHEYFRKLEGLVKTFDFTRKGEGESMGKDAALKVAQGIVNRSAAQQAGVDGIFLANDPKYTADKVKRYGTDLIGFRTGQMISLPSLLGHVDVTPNTVLMTYGTNTPPSRSISSSYISTSDQAVTDTQKAEYFTDRKGRWYAIDDTIADNVRGYFADQLSGFIRELNAR